MSIHQSIMQQAGMPSLMAAVANTVVVYFPDGGNSGTQFDVITSAPEFSEELNTETGEVLRRERIKMTAVASDLRDAGIDYVQHGAQVEVNGERWQVDTDATIWGDILVDIGLTRKPLVLKQEARSASV